MKNSYILDTVEVNNKDSLTYVRHLSNQQIILVSSLKSDIYQLKINLECHPPKIDLTSIDSIYLPKFRYSMTFLDVLPIFSNNLIVLFQNNPQSYPSLKG